MGWGGKLKEETDEKGAWGTVWGEGTVLDFHCGGDYTVVSLLKLIELYINLCVNLLYVNYVSINLIVKIYIFLKICLCVSAGTEAMHLPQCGLEALVPGCQSRPQSGWFGSARQ